MVAAGYDLPYIQAQVGHRDPSTTLAIYAQVIARPDRDELRPPVLGAEAGAVRFGHSRESTDPRAGTPDTY
jgi:hypothetical protein